MNGKTPFGPLAVKVVGEVLSSEFTTAVRLNCLDLDTMLGVEPSLEADVLGKSLVLRAHER